MKAFGNGVRAVLALVVMGGLLLGVALAARAFLRFLFDGVDPTVAAAIVGAFATVLISVGTVVLGRYLERRKSLEQQIQASKIPVYSKLIVTFFDLLHGLNEEDADQEDPAFVAKLQALTPDLITWASNDVIKAWAAFKRGAEDRTPQAQIMAFEDLLFVIRKDIGQPSGNLERGDLLSLFLNDVEEALEVDALTRSGAEQPGE